MTNQKRLKRGFTLAETVIALGIAALALSFFIAAFAPATIGLKKSERIEEAKTLVSALEAELNILRASEVLDTQDPNSTGYVSPFDKAFQWTAFSEADEDNLIIGFQYRADSDNASDADGLLPAFTDAISISATSTSGDAHEMTTHDQQMIKQSRITLVSKVNGGIDQARYGQIEGNAYVFRLKHVQNNGTSLGVVAGGDSTTIYNSDGATIAATSDAYDQAALLIQVEVYHVKSSALSYLQSFGYTDIVNDTVKPLYTTHIGILR